jgi:hypothetical protein
MVDVTNGQEIRLNRLPVPWLGGEARVHVVHSEANFPSGYNLVDAQILDIAYRGGGLGGLFDLIEAAAQIPSRGSFQAMLENLEALSSSGALILVVRGATQLLADVGPALLHIMAGWEGFAHHATGVSAMYLVLDTGPAERVNAAFNPGGVIEWL